MPQNFPVKGDLSKVTQAEIDRISAKPSAQRTSSEQAFLDARAIYLTNTILELDSSNDILRCAGNTLPADGLSGFAKGCVFIKLNASAGVSGTYENVGTSSSCDFNLVSSSSGTIFDVRNYGAKFDGTTDDKTAIQAALNAANAAGGGIVEMPAGTAKYSGVMTVYPNTTVRGQGSRVTKLLTTATSGALPGGAAFQSSTNSDDFIRFEGFELGGQGEDATSGTGITFGTGGVHSFLSFKDLYIHDFPNHCLFVEDPILSTFERLWLKNAGQDGLYINIGTSCTFTAIYATGCDRSGIHLKSHTYSVLNGCAAEYCTTGYWMEGSNNIVLNGCGGEIAMDADAGSTGTVAHYRLQSSSHITMNSCYSTKFAYLHSVSAYHIYITGSDNIGINQFRGKAPSGGADPGEAPTNTILIDAASEVHGRNVEFETMLGDGQSGTFKTFVSSGGTRSGSEKDDGNSGTADTVDWGASNFHKSTLTGNVTYTFTAPNGPAELFLKVTQDATGSRTITWPATVKWPSGSAPTITATANKSDLFRFYWDGANYWGSTVGQNYS
jgi:hypothetical protein